MEAKRNSSAGGSTLGRQQNNCKPELPDAAMEVLKNIKLILAIVCARDNVDFIMKDETVVSCRMKFEDLMPSLKPTVFLRIHRCWAINMYFMLDYRQGPKEWWVQLTDRQRYNVSESFHEIFLDNLFYMIKNKRIRKEKEKTRRRFLFRSKWDI